LREDSRTSQATPQSSFLLPARRSSRCRCSPARAREHADYQERFVFEASLALLAYITFVGCCLALRQNNHLKVDVFVRLLPRAGQAVVFILIQCTIITIAVVMLVMYTAEIQASGNEDKNVLW